MGDLAMDIAERLKTKREERGESAATTAGFLETSAGRLLTYEKGEVIPNIRFYDRWAAHLGVSIVIGAPIEDGNGAGATAPPNLFRPSRVLAKDPDRIARIAPKTPKGEGPAKAKRRY